MRVEYCYNYIDKKQLSTCYNNNSIITKSKPYYALCMDWHTCYVIFCYNEPANYNNDNVLYYGDILLSRKITILELENIIQYFVFAWLRFH